MHKFVSRVTSLAAILFVGTTWAQAPTNNAALEKWREYAGVSWDLTRERDGNIARFTGSVTAPIAGLHFDANGTAYVSTPRLLSANAPATLSLLDLSAQTGPARLTAFPSMAANKTDGGTKGSLRNVLGFHVDQTNGWLWALDMGFVAGEPEAPVGAQKLVVFDLKSGAIVKIIVLDAVADRKGSFLNDIAVDENNRIAYVSDSGMRSAPNNQAGILVIDFTSSKLRRVLHQHASVQIEANVKVYSHGEEVWANNPLLIGINGIALSPDAQTLYWTVTTGTKLHALPTKVLRNFNVPNTKIAAAVRDLGSVGGNTDGIVTTANGNLYITDVTRNGLVRYDPRSKKMQMAAANEGVFWPDTATVGPESAVYFTASNLSAHFGGLVKDGQERYQIWKMTAPK